jgi:hypothetical protein
MLASEEGSGRGFVQGYDIRRARRADIEAISAYLRANWRADHVFVEHPSLLAWQHADPDDPEALTFILAFDGAGAMRGLLGYIPTRRFDPALEPDAFLAIWKTDEAAAGLGLSMLMAYRRIVRPRLTGAIGLSRMVIPIYRALNFTVGALSQWCLLNEAASTRALWSGSAPARPASAALRRHAILLDDLGALDRDKAAIDAMGRAAAARKSAAHLMERYGRHPVYRYRAVLTPPDGEDCGGLLVLREVAAGGGKALRGVDYVGSDAALAAMAAPLADLLRREDLEYVDLYAHGLDGARLEAAGFTDAQGPGDLVVANYFEPFALSKVTLDFAYRAEAGCEAPVRLFKGDADQDRPNRLT